jgi:hypothetical protein
VFVVKVKFTTIHGTTPSLALWLRRGSPCPLPAVIATAALCRCMYVCWDLHASARYTANVGSTGVAFAVPVGPGLLVSGECICNMHASNHSHHRLRAPLPYPDLNRRPPPPGRRGSRRPAHRRLATAGPPSRSGGDSSPTPETPNPNLGTLTRTLNSPE